MEKGSLRRLARPLCGGLVLLGLAAALAHPGGPRRVRPQERPGPPASATTWWEISLVVTVRGEYTVRGLEAPPSGTYACRARWIGRLELDSDDDFVLVHLGTEILDWSLREKAARDGGESLLEAAPGVKPALRMEYLLKDGAEVEFVFGLGGVGVPLHAPELGLPLELPRTSSRQPGLPGRSYGDFVRRGSCRVAVPGSDFVEQAPERRFAWTWGRERQYVREGRTLVLSQSHTAEAVVSLIVH